MMKALFVTFIILISLAFIIIDEVPEPFWTDLEQESTEEIDEEETNNNTGNDSNTDLSESNEDTDGEENIEATDSLADWIHESEEDVREVYGEPDRQDITPYGYTWYVYNLSDDYVQFGISDEGQVKTAVSPSFNDGDVAIGDSYDRIADFYDINPEQTITKTDETFTFQLSGEELERKPLVHIEEDVWAQFYIDTVEDELSSVRYLQEDVLLLQRPYSLTYSGDLPEKNDLSENETAEWQDGQARQVLDMTNEIRERHGLTALTWHEETAETAYLHSRDMHDEGFFSHTSPQTGTLSDRLENGNIQYTLAGENIAAYYTDAASAVEGWMNSEGHRVNMLNDEFTHLGAGVFQTYYTQNFLVPG